MVSPPAWIAAAGTASVYGGRLYVVPGARAQASSRAPDGEPYTRDHPRVIRRRVIAVSGASIVALAIVAGTIALVEPGLSTADVLYKTVSLTGLIGHNSLRGSVVAAAIPLALVLVLFVGSLYVAVLDGDLIDIPGTPASRWRLIRNLVVAPITEEFVFRGAIVGLYQLAGASTRTLVFVTPLWFGLGAFTVIDWLTTAHAHHAYDVYRTGGRTRRALNAGIAQAVFQAVYTTLFGSFAAFCLVRTRSLYGVIGAHAFCNAFGLPNIGGAVKAYPHKRVQIGAAYVLGVAGFTGSLLLLTASQ